MKKIYVVACCCSGKYYYKDEPKILGAFEKYEDAKQFFDEEVSTWQEGVSAHRYKDEVVEYVSENMVCVVYECTDFDAKEHMYLKLYYVELNKMI